MAPMRCPWGQKAFLAYLGANQEQWRNYDASELVQRGDFNAIKPTQTTQPNARRKELTP